MSRRAAESIVLVHRGQHRVAPKKPISTTTKSPPKYAFNGNNDAISPFLTTRYYRLRNRIVEDVHFPTTASTLPALAVRPIPPNSNPKTVLTVIRMR